MTKLPMFLAGLGAIALTTAPALAKGSRVEEAHEKPIALSQAPKVAVEAAQKALGGDITEAEVVSAKGRVYELSTKDASGKGKVRARDGGRQDPEDRDRA